MIHDTKTAPLVDDGGCFQQVGLCQYCNQAVEQAQATYQQLLEAVKCFKRIQMELIRKIKSARTTTELKNNDTESQDGQENEALSEWRNFILNHDYNGITADSFLIEDFNIIVQNLHKSLARSCSESLSVTSVKNKNSIEDPVSESSDNEMDSDVICSGTEESDEETSTLTNNEHIEVKEEVELLDEYDQNEEQLEAPIRNEEDEEEWTPEDDPLDIDNSNSERSNSIGSGSEEEEYIPPKKRGKRKAKAINRKSAIKRKRQKPARYWCTEEGCSKSYTTKLCFDKHVRTMHLKKFKCEVCKEKFQDKEKLASHVSTLHPKHSFSCDICPRFFCSEKGLKLHLFGYHHIKTFYGKRKKIEHPCTEPDCKKVYKSLEALKIHLSRHKGEPMYPCAECDMVFWSWQQRQRHNDKTHVAGGVKKAFVCETCGGGFSCLHYLQVHINSRHKGRPPKDSSSGTDGSVEMCELCGKTFTTKIGLYYHNRNIHLKNITKKLGSYTCEICGEKFDTRILFRNHLYRQHKQSTDKDRYTSEFRDYHKDYRENVKFRCNVVGCRLRFWGQENYNKHMTTAHGQDGKSKQYKCNECGKEFSILFKYREHTLIHINKETRPFKCDTCGKGFVNFGNLRYHQVNTHKAPRLFERRKETKPRSFLNKRAKSETPAVTVTQQDADVEVSTGNKDE